MDEEEELYIKRKIWTADGKEMKNPVLKPGARFAEKRVSGQ